jgi:Rps23 Pro-64 3,4-dihydroxylase Tpa1-like proline 4-hydroxylase
VTMTSETVGVLLIEYIADIISRNDNNLQSKVLHSAVIICIQIINNLHSNYQLAFELSFTLDRNNLLIGKFHACKIATTSFRKSNQDDLSTQLRPYKIKRQTQEFKNKNDTVRSQTHSLCNGKVQRRCTISCGMCTNQNRLHDTLWVCSRPGI